MEYLDFELEIGKRNSDGYLVTVRRSPGGKAKETMQLDVSKLGHCFSSPDHAAVSGDNNARHVSLGVRQFTKPQDLQACGEFLFKKLFAGKILRCYSDSKAHAAKQSRKEEREVGIRLLIRIIAPELMAIPWELLYDPNSSRFICLSRETVLVRFIVLPESTKPLELKLPMRILLVRSGPKNLSELCLEKEEEIIEEALQDLYARHLVEREWLRDPTWQDLQQTMIKGPWDILHFIGHGAFDESKQEGVIILVDEHKNAEPILASDLAVLLDDYNLKLAVLNCCDGARGNESSIFSSTATTLIRRGVPAVLGMRGEITNSAAIAFSRAFYSVLADKFPVDVALVEGRKAILLSRGDKAEWFTPILFMRTAERRGKRNWKLWVLLLSLLLAFGAILPIAIIRSSAQPVAEDTPHDPAAVLTIAMAPAKGAERTFEGKIENLKPGSRLWLFGRNDQADNWQCLGAADIYDSNWSKKVPIRQPFKTPESFYAAVLASDSNYSLEGPIKELPSQSVLSSQIVIVDRPRVWIETIEGQDIKNGTGPKITPLSWIKVTGKSESLLPTERIWVNVFGETRKAMPLEVLKDGSWTGNVWVPLPQRLRFTLFASLSLDDPGTDRKDQGEGITCASK